MPHELDENSAENQADPKKIPPSAAAGENPPREARIPIVEKPTRASRRHKTAAGIYAIYETAHYGLRDMGAKRSLKLLGEMNQKDGFDCPSCAWPDPDDKRSVTEFCENGAKAVAAEATTARVTREFFAKYSIEQLAEQQDMWLEQQGRLTEPMVLRRGEKHYQPISWNAAFELIAEELNALPSPDEAVFYTSGRASNEVAFLYQLFVRQFGTNNLPDCSNMCHESTGVGLKDSIGFGKATVIIEDFDHADAIFIIGQNPGTCHPRMLTYLQKAARNGCQIVSMNPLPESGMIRFKHPQRPWEFLGPGTAIANLFLPVRINGDVAALKGIMKEMLEEDERTGGKILDHHFITDQTEGFETFADDLRRESWELIVEQSGLSREQIKAGARIALESNRMICCWAMGITQHQNGVANVHMIANFALLRAQIGRKGAGLCPVRGHSNVQGDRTMGIWEKISPQMRESLKKEFNFTPPEKDGYDTVHALAAMHEGKVKVFLALGGNLLSAGPDTDFTAEAMRRCRLTAQISTKLNRSHLVTGEQALILPCLGRTEQDLQKDGPQFVTVENTTGVVHQSHGTLEPASPHLLSECAIVGKIAAKTLKGRTDIEWEKLIANYDGIRALIERVVPGCEQYNNRVRQPGGYYLPNPAREGKFPTPSGKAQFKVHPIPRHDIGRGKWLLMSIRSHDQFNTTVYGLSDRYRGIHGGRRVVFLNADDMKAEGLKQGQRVNLISTHAGVKRRADHFQVVEYPIPRWCAAAYFPETNVLVPVGYIAEGSNQPASKSVPITIEAAE